MTLVNASTGERVGTSGFSQEYPPDAWVSGTGDLNRDDASRLTAKIKGYAGRTFQLLAEAHDRKAWKALGFTSWAQYVAIEFDMSKSRAYQLVSQARIVAELAEIAEVSTDVDTSPLVSEAAARDIAPVMGEVRSAIEAELAEHPEADEAERAEMVEKIVEEKRTEVTRRATERAQSAGGGTPVPSDAPSPPATDDAPPSPAEPPEIPIDPAVKARLRLSKAIDKVADLLDINPADIGSYLLAEDRTAHLRFLDDIEAWAALSRESLSTRLRSVQ